ncbi:hypothetical protein [Cobetia sp. 1AS1]|uniref:hypothetical protein n=1 Tax=Cobetia sp. 1AS1 TaxID=3040016 RepID=UPI00244C469D|nr:hypothetical protein [Cobetia sp. 1AS1]MDH2293552.1 hypothetical protein [Cobetia sp. 1AS1]
MKELLVFIYWLVLLSGLLGWLCRVHDINSSSEGHRSWKKHIPSVLNFFMISALVFAYVYHVLFSVHHNYYILIFVLVPFVVSLEYACILLRDKIFMLLRLFTIRIIFLVMGVLIVSYVNSISSGYIAQLTGVYPSVFDTFIYFFVFFLSGALWVVVVQFFLILALLAFYLKYIEVKGKDLSLSLFYICVVSLCIAFLSFVAHYLTHDFVRISFEKYFVQYSYHENKSSSGGFICKNLNGSERIVLLPSGRVSIVREGVDNDYVFYVSDCEHSNELPSKNK